MTDPVTILTTITQSQGVVKVIQDLLKKDKPDVLALREHITALRQQLLARASPATQSEVARTSVQTKLRSGSAKGAHQTFWGVSQSNSAKIAELCRKRMGKAAFSLRRWVYHETMSGRTPL